MAVISDVTLLCNRRDVTCPFKTEDIEAPNMNARGIYQNVLCSKTFTGNLHGLPWLYLL